MNNNKSVQIQILSQDNYHEAHSDLGCYYSLVKEESKFIDVAILADEGNKVEIPIDDSNGIIRMTFKSLSNDKVIGTLLLVIANIQFDQIESHQITSELHVKLRISLMNSDSNNEKEVKYFTSERLSSTKYSSICKESPSFLRQDDNEWHQKFLKSQQALEKLQKEHAIVLAANRDQVQMIKVSQEENYHYKQLCHKQEIEIMHLKSNEKDIQSQLQQIKDNTANNIHEYDDLRNKTKSKDILLQKLHKRIKSLEQEHNRIQSQLQSNEKLLILSEEQNKCIEILNQKLLTSQAEQKQEICMLKEQVKRGELMLRRFQMEQEWATRQLN